ncbi:MAG: DHH family phosphoesterase [Bacteroidia bacterium]
MPIDTTSELLQKLQQKAYSRIAITTHHKPDGDAMGSSLGLAALLQGFCQQVQVITPTDYADTYQWLPGNDKVWVYEGMEAQSEAYLASCDAVFCLDFNRLSRINFLGEVVRELKCDKIMIDHHLEVEEFYHYALWDTRASSTCELIFDFYQKLTGAKLSLDAATCLYTGMMTDTGHFQYANTTPHTLNVAAELLAMGVDQVAIRERIFDSFSADRSRLFGYCLHEKMQLLAGGQVALIYLSAEELQRFNVQTGDTEGLVNFGLNIKGVRMSALVIDRTERVKMSFRSKGDIAVNEYSAQWFSGGGHKNAAGGKSEDSLENTVALFKKTVVEFQKTWK